MQIPAISPPLNPGGIGGKRRNSSHAATQTIPSQRIDRLIPRLYAGGGGGGNGESGGWRDAEFLMRAGELSADSVTTRTVPARSGEPAAEHERY